MYFNKYVKLKQKPGEYDILRIPENFDETLAFKNS